MAIPDSPLTREEQYLNNIATGGGILPDVPITRREQYLNYIATGDGVLPEPPLTREERYLHEIAVNGGGGVDPESITLVTLNVSLNGTTNAPSGKAYNKVVANVPNTYGAGDEGKVVSNGSLVSQTAHAEVTQNGTIDTTLNNSVTVNVPTGSDITLDTLTATANGTYTPTSGHAYSSVVVAIPAVTGVSF